MPGKNINSFDANSTAFSSKPDNSLHSDTARQSSQESETKTPVATTAENIARQLPKAAILGSSSSVNASEGRPLRLSYSISHLQNVQKFIGKSSGLESTLVDRINKYLKDARNANVTLEGKSKEIFFDDMRAVNKFLESSSGENPYKAMARSSLKQLSLLEGKKEQSQSSRAHYSAVQNKPSSVFQSQQRKLKLADLHNDLALLENKLANLEKNHGNLFKINNSLKTDKSQADERGHAFSNLITSARSEYKLPRLSASIDSLEKVFEDVESLINIYDTMNSKNIDSKLAQIISYQDRHDDYSQGDLGDDFKGSLDSVNLIVDTLLENIKIKAGEFVDSKSSQDKIFQAEKEDDDSLSLTEAMSKFKLSSDVPGKVKSDVEQVLSENDVDKIPSALKKLKVKYHKSKDTESLQALNILDRDIFSRMKNEAS